MQITKSILCLWAGCSVLAGCSAYYIGAHDLLNALADDLQKIDYSGGPSFALAFPMLEAQVVAGAGGVLALVGLLLSWRLNKQPLLSWPHVACLFFLAPAVFALLFR